ncbi:uncharacterized protein [Bemisia tabaci]|uniref:uncharacterized protein n=1 Tax=Bemisia tabaci TaxID=7038 RepID=UPI003B280165
MSSGGLYFSDKSVQPKSSTLPGTSSHFRTLASSSHSTASTPPTLNQPSKTNSAGKLVPGMKQRVPSYRNSPPYQQGKSSSQGNVTRNLQGKSSQNSEDKSAAVRNGPANQSGVNNNQISSCSNSGGGAVPEGDETVSLRDIIDGLKKHVQEKCSGQDNQSKK